MEPGHFLLSIGRSAVALVAVAGLTATTPAHAAPPDPAPAPATRAAQRAPLHVPAYPVGGSAFTARATHGARYVVLTDGEAALARALADGITPIEVWRIGIHGFVADLDDAQVTRLRAIQGVTGIEPDGELTAAGQQLSPPWGLDRIDQTNLPLDGSYTYPTTGLGVTAYVIDSGIWETHTEFTGRIPYGYYWDYGDGRQIQDCSGHGTHVSATLGGTTYGVAKDVTIVPVKVLDCDGSGPTSAILAGIESVIEDHEAGVPAVANMSVGGPASSVVDDAVRAMIADGITVVAAAGNAATDSCLDSPGRVPEVITVAASTQTDNAAGFSNSGPCNDLFAPGVGVLSAWPGPTDDETMLESGTSMASPHVAGVAALVLESAPASSPAEVWATIDQASTKGLIDECCGEPDKLLSLPSLSAGPPPPDLRTVQPARLYDSRAGDGPLPAGWTVAVQVGGLAGVPGNATLAALNVTAVEPQGAGYLTMFPCDADAVPNASNLNFRAGQTIPNAAVVTLASDGTVCIYTSATTGLLVDVNGFAPATTRLAALDPFRLFDSRSSGAPRPAGSITEVQVAGAGGVDAASTAALLNVTAVDAVADGYLTVFPCGTNPPNASNVNFRAGQTVANAALGRIGAGGKVCVYTSAAAGIIVDVNAAVPALATVAPVDPYRLYDSRQLGGPVAPGSVTVVQVAGLGGVPATATTAVLNVTALEAADAGYITVYPCGTSLPNASNLNFARGDTIPNAVIAKLGPTGAVCVYTSAGAGVLVDVNGYAT